MHRTSIHIISGYVASKYNDRDNIKMTINELKMPTLEKTEALDSMADGLDKDIYREDVKSYANDNCELTRSAKNVYSLVLGQCTEILRTKIK